MKVLVRDRYGSPDVLQLAERPKPEPADDAVLVRVHATSVNAYDWHMLRGKPYMARPGEGLWRPKTTVLGLDVAGVVEEVGSKVTDLKVGDRVFGSRSGAFAEYVTSKNMVAMPANLSFEEAAAVPVAGQTALQGLRDKGRVEPGQRVLVVGAGGGVGTFAVQIARALGARVTAATGPRCLELVASLGVDEVVDYTRGDFTRGRDRYDVILDIGGRRRMAHLRRLLTPVGRIVLVAPAPGDWLGPIARVAAAALGSRFRRQKVIPFLSQGSRQDLGELRRLLEAGTIRPVIDRIHSFEEIPEAIRHVERGEARGKVVIRVRPGSAPGE